MTKSENADRLNAMAGTIKELEAANSDYAAKLRAAQERIAELERTRVITSPDAAVSLVNALELAELKAHATWISVKERLPNAEENVQAWCETRATGRGYVCCAQYIPEHTAEALRWDDECSEYDEQYDKCWVLEGWYEYIYNGDEYWLVGIGDFVTHWMPLPEPPKEATHE